MTPERWRRIEDLFHAALARTPETREAFVAEACAGDEALRADVQSLIAQPDGSLLAAGLPSAVAALAGPATRVSYQGEALGPYVLGGLLGRGGMSDVYRARDRNLGRDVAVKILPDAVAQDPARIARFEREARALAALNHPHIAAIYGIESRDGIRGLVLELVEGATLAEMLAAGAGSRSSRRPLPVRQALVFARQISEALEAAHEKGIIHRDLKPANVKVTPAGLVKVLDFGVAKVEASDTPDNLGPDAPAVVATGDGILVGTVAYMSPEQARGQSIDKRTDIWAFGCVLYELLAGHRPFAGVTPADVLEAIANAEPDWARLPADTPAGVRDLVQRCLTKDPARRLQQIAGARTAIDEAVRASGADGPAASLARGRLVRWLAAGAVAGLGAVAAWYAVSARTPEPSIPMRVSIELPADVSVYAIGRGSSVAVSPDGGHVVYVAALGDSTQLYRRSLDGLDNTPIAGTEGGTNPFFSPDGRWIGFRAEGQLRKVPAAGGAVTTMVEGASMLGAAWGPDDTIVFLPGLHGGLWRIPAGGGERTRATTRADGELTHSWPQILPGGRHVLFTVWNNTGFEGGRIVVQPLDGGAPQVVIEQASYGRVVALDGGRAWLVFARPEGLLAAPFEPASLRLTGPAVPVVDGVMTNLSGGAHFSFSASGVLAYLPGGLDEAEKTLLWVGRDGTEREAPRVPGIGFQYRLSPDGRRLARPNAAGMNRDLRVDDLETGTSRALTSDTITNRPIWTPDGRRIVYTAGVPNGNLFWQPADGSGQPDRVTTSGNLQQAGSVSDDGTLVYSELDPDSGSDIWSLSLYGSRRPQLFLGTPAHERSPRILPNGRWVAYQSNETGQPEIWIASFPEPSVRLQVSTGGGNGPIWSPDGGELYYRTQPSEDGGGRMMAIAIDTTGPAPVLGTPRVLFDGPYQGDGDVAPDGRFLLVRQTTRESTARVIQLVLNWFDDLQQRVPLR